MSAPEGWVAAEAFCLMKYASSPQESPDGQVEIEWIWNSRNGTTPFAVPSRRNPGLMLCHSNFELDTKLPEEFVPEPTMRVFVDPTPEQISYLSVVQVDRYLKDEGLRDQFLRTYGSRGRAIGAFTENRQPGVPICVEWEHRANPQPPLPEPVRLGPARA